VAVQPGEHVAIVGATGEGKTTCARLLNRFYDVARGRVLIEGMDVREWDLAALRRHVGIIFQDTVLFTGSVESNLQLGLDGRVTRPDLDRAIDAAHCRRLVETLPRGLGEELLERGANLSHGQRQLLAIARALVYNPAVLVLDEATSSVDPESEALIRRALARVVTYGQVAERLGRPRGRRAVGHAMRECPHDLPWHRVVNSAGGMSPRARMSGMITQRLRLEAEGMRRRGGRVSLTRYRW